MINNQLETEINFQVYALAKTPLPQTLVYQALHQDYSSSPVHNQRSPTETECGNIAVKRLLNGDKGHHGPLEHPTITFNCVNFPHSVVQQARTHRIATFDVQSFRYTEEIQNLGLFIFTQLEAGQSQDKYFSEIERLFYLRPVGEYASRSGRNFTYTKELRAKDLDLIACSAMNYSTNLQSGMPAEQARGIVPFDYRQHFLVTFNLRSLMHFLDLRGKADAQWEIQQLAEMMLLEGKQWCPEIMGWYEEKRWRKGKLAP